MTRKFYAITFTYHFANYQIFPNVQTKYKAKGKIYLDPDDGEWKSEGPFENLGLTLSDNGVDEYLNDIHKKMKPFDFASTLPSKQ